MACSRSTGVRINWNNKVVFECDRYRYHRNCSDTIYSGIVISGYKYTKHGDVVISGSGDSDNNGCGSSTYKYYCVARQPV